MPQGGGFGNSHFWVFNTNPRGLGSCMQNSELASDIAKAFA